MEENAKLVYKYNPRTALGFIPGVPARDLTAAELKDVLAAGITEEQLLLAGYVKVPTTKSNRKEGE